MICPIFITLYYHCHLKYQKQLHFNHLWKICLECRMKFAQCVLNRWMLYNFLVLIGFVRYVYKHGLTWLVEGVYVAPFVGEQKYIIMSYRPMSRKKKNRLLAFYLETTSIAIIYSAYCLLLHCI